MSSLRLNKITQAMGLAALMGASVSAPVAFAAEAAADEDVEIIQVRGIRGSLKESMNTKRFSTATVDAVNAEDVGKFPDQNVAESLGRIPGVAVSRQFGEGSAVSIRGVSNDLTLTTLNGQNVASAGWYSQQPIDRTFNYSMLAPEMIAGIEVYKSSQADLLEGGVGGTVIVKTRKPLDLDPLTAFATVKGTYGSISEETDANISALGSWKNEEETFGILLAVSSNEYTLERRGVENAIAWGGRSGLSNIMQERNRETIDFVAQWAPTDELDMSFQYMNMELEADNTNTALWLPADMSNCTNPVNSRPNATGESCVNTLEWIQSTIGIDQNDDAFAAPTGNRNAAAMPQYDTRPRFATMETELFAYELSYQADGAKFDFQVGYSKATGGTNFETNVGVLTNPFDNIGSTTVNSSGTKLNGQETANIDFPEAGEYFSWEGYATGAAISEPREDKESYVQGDVEFDVDLGAITSIKTGFRWSDHEVSVDAFAGNFGDYDNVAQGPDAAYFVNGTFNAGTNDELIPKPDVAAIMDWTNRHLKSFDQRRAGYAGLTEENMSSYIMAKFEGDGFRGNFGFRYIDTKVTGESFAVDAAFVDDVTDGLNNTYTTDIDTLTHDYNDTLPSLNIAFDVREDLIVRFSAAEVISRPKYDDMFTNQSLSGLTDTNPDNQVATTGSVALSPFKAVQGDLGIEYYYSEDSMFAAAVFMKSIQNFHTSSQSENQSIGIIPSVGEDNWTVTTNVDGDGGSVQGLELQLQHAFDNGFGGVINYTYADSKADSTDNFIDGNDVLSDTSENSLNVVAYYETDVFSARAAYSWRSEYMIREGSGFYGDREHDAFGTLDLSASYNLNENITFTFDVVNVLEEDSVQKGAHQENTGTQFDSGYHAYVYQGEARYSIGAQFRF
ncbi:TonB-dependent receptor [Catenovulum sp. SM1970]|uniref:TonB-dependent receptor n=1 Tax=Marinifaba aquimaris TaxID=2741323 RepID=UPI0015722F6F|nr:TonB-dependent receptor [Marinifaba aquimaris]NTS78658.1 TonB-dependent receptor [Marinifaba aquimaris]